MLQTAYVLGLPLIMDEFHGAAEVQRLTQATPYVDFVPYKTVLGYYIQLPVQLLVPQVWEGLIAAKLWLVLINIAALLVLCLGLAHTFDRHAVLLALPLLVLMTTFLERSAELRVDMLSAWAGAVSLLLLLKGRYAWAGAAAAMSFLISQKGATFVLAGGIAALLPLGAAQVGRAAKYAGAAALGLGVYLAGWAWVSSLELVARSTVARAVVVAVRPVPMPRIPFWVDTILPNPLFWTLALLGLWRLARPQEGAAPDPGRLRLAVYGGVVITMGIVYRQPWPYHFVVLLPTLFVLIVSWLNDVLRERRLRSAGRWPLPLGLAYIAGGLLLPALHIPLVFSRDNRFQREVVQRADAWVTREDTYLAGLELLRNKVHFPGRMAWLDGFRRLGFAQQSPEEQRAVLGPLQAAPPKLLVDNYRLRDLPCEFRRFFDSTYQRSWANLWLYAPALPQGASTIRLAHAGAYAVLAPVGAVLKLDGKTLQHGEVIDLHLGEYQVTAEGPSRLALQPPTVPTVDPGPHELFYQPYFYRLRFHLVPVESPDSFSAGCGSPN